MKAVHNGYQYFISSVCYNSNDISNITSLNFNPVSPISSGTRIIIKRQI